MLFAGNLARICVRAAPGFGRADLTNFFQSAIARGSFAGRSPVRWSSPTEVVLRYV
jgi:hypothetical protein